MALFVALLDSRNIKIAIVFAVACVACGMGALRMQSAVLVGDPALDLVVGEKIAFVGVVSDEPDSRATQVRVPIRVTEARQLGEVDQATSTVAATILAIFPSHTALYYGERVYFSGTLARPEAFGAGTGRSFNYPGYLAAQGIQYELDRATLFSGDGFEGNPMTAFAYRIKESFILGLERALPEPQSALAGGIDVGDKRAMSKDLSQEFRTVSLVHIVVLSGYNITVVIDSLFKALAWAPRTIRFGAGGFVALFFAVMTGFASASLRAALMALIAISGSLSGRIYRADRALILVSLAMLVWNPYLLVFDPGFQLSFLACEGLLLFSPIFAQWFSKVPERFGMRDILVSTCSAQSAVLPLLLYQSGTLSLVSIPANLLVLAIVPSTMFFSAFAALGGLVYEPLAPFIGLPAYALLSYILNVTHVFASVPFAAITVPAFSAWVLLPIYSALFGAGMYLNTGLQNKTAR